jgi:hypothetical protein
MNIFITLLEHLLTDQTNHATSAGIAALSKKLKINFFWTKLESVSAGTISN